MNGHVRERKTASSTTTTTTAAAISPSASAAYVSDAHHSRHRPKHGLAMEGLRIVAFTIYFMTCITSIHAAQFLGLPLLWYNKDWYKAWVALTKAYFGIHITTMTYWWSPTPVRVTGDSSVAGLLTQSQDGLVNVNFGERVLLMANHQLYTDWLYMWWAAYTNSPPMHGHIYIILKETLKWTPMVGPAMQLYGFIFMARKWASDQARLRDGLRRLNSQSSAVTPESANTTKADNTAAKLDPMWLLIFPEGTNLSANERAKSAAFCEKTGKKDMRYQVLPRPAGLHLLLQELKATVPYLYDCTIGYAPIPPGKFGAELYGLRTVYIQGNPPESVHMHWRRFATRDIPIESKEALQVWLEARWQEKDDLLDAFYREGRFPGDPAAIASASASAAPAGTEKNAPAIMTEVRPRMALEWVQMFMPVAAAAVVVRIGFQMVSRLTGR